MPARKAAVPKDGPGQSETERKTVIYDRDTGLFVDWYTTLRGEEECNRASRYGRPLALLVVEPAPGFDAWAGPGIIAFWLQQRVRTADVAGYLGNSRFLVIMPETNVDAAGKVAERLRSEFSDLQTGVSAVPDDGATFDQLYAVALGRLNEPIAPAA